MNWIYIFVPLVLGLGVALFWVWRRLVSPSTRLPVTASWIEELTPERYLPMLRLLDLGDFEFLRSQPGYSRRSVSRLRAQRCQLFRGYLRSLNDDFQRVATALKLILTYSSHDRPDLASMLVRQQVQFALGMAAVEVRLFLYRWDLCGVDVKGLVQIFDSLRLELQALVPATAELTA